MRNGRSESVAIGMTGDEAEAAESVESRGGAKPTLCAIHEDQEGRAQLELSGLWHQACRQPAILASARRKKARALRAVHGQVALSCSYSSLCVQPAIHLR